MSPVILGALLVATLAALLAVLLGRNLTRSVTAGLVFFASLGLGLLLAGAGFAAMVVVILGVLMLGVIQTFGWMLVDVDRDHLVPRDRPTGLARSLAFVLLGGGLGLLLFGLVSGGELGVVLDPLARQPGLSTLGWSPAEIGRLLFGPMRDLTILLGMAIGSGLLATLLLLQDDGEAD